MYLARQSLLYAYACSNSAHCCLIISQFIDKKQTMDIQRKRKERSRHFLFDKKQTMDIQRKKKEHTKKNVKNPPFLSSNIKMPAKKNIKTVVIDVSQEPSDDEEYPDYHPICSKCGGCPCDWGGPIWSQSSRARSCVEIEGTRW